MNYKKSCVYIAICLSFLMTMIGATASELPQRLVQIDFTNTTELKNFVGLILTDTSTRQLPIANINKQSHATTVDITIPSELATSSVYALAIAQKEDGSLVYSNVRAAEKIGTTSSLTTLPICLEEAVDLNMQNQISLITNLLQVRAKRRANYEAKLKEKLSGKLLEKLQSYETGFGLEREQQLSTDLTAVELVDRLNRILHTLRKISPNT